MKKLYFLLPLWVYFFSLNTVFAQHNINGVWQGILTQPHETETLSHNYAFWIEITQIKNILSGHCRIEIAQTSNFAIIQFRGKIVDSVMQFQQFKITNKVIKQNAHWCMITGFLTHYSEENSLRGTWKSISAGCTDGEVVLFKTNEHFNSTKAQTHNYTQLDTIKTRLRKHQTVLDRKIVLHNIHFDSNKSTLKVSSNTALNELFELLQQFPRLKIRINGHTDAIGNDANNLKLSMERAKSVVHYLIEKGIEVKRLSSQGFGEARPLAENLNEQGREENRRVEFEIVGQ